MIENWRICTKKKKSNNKKIDTINAKLARKILIKQNKKNYEKSGKWMKENKK